MIGQYDDPFKKFTYLVLRLGMKKAKLDPTLNLGSALGAQTAQLEDLVGSELGISDLRASQPAVTFERKRVANLRFNRLLVEVHFPSGTLVPSRKLVVAQRSVRLIASSATG